MSRQSHIANDKGDNEIIPGAVYRSPGIYLAAEENPARIPSMKAVRLVIASNGVPYLQMSSAGSYSTSGRKKEGKNERTG